MSSTPRLGLPFLSAGQAQKEVFHNEALQTLDLIVAGAVEGLPQPSPPASPAIGDCYLIDDAPTGLWVGAAQNLAAFTSAGWRFVAPREGMVFYIRSTGTFAAFRAGNWEIGEMRGSSVIIDGQQVVGGQAAAIASPVGGASVDTQARAVIDQILIAMRQHGLIAP